MPTVDQKALQQHARKIVDQKIKVTIEEKEVEMSVRDYFRKQNEVNYAYLKAAIIDFTANPENEADSEALKADCFGENKAITIEFIRAVEDECNKSTLQREGFSILSFLTFNFTVSILTAAFLTMFAPHVIAAIGALVAVTNPFGALFLGFGLISAALMLITATAAFAVHKMEQKHVGIDNAMKAHAEALLETENKSKEILQGGELKSDCVRLAFFNTFGGFNFIKPIPDAMEKPLFESAPITPKVYNQYTAQGLYTEEESKAIKSKSLKELEIEGYKRSIPSRPGHDTHKKVAEKAPVRTPLSEATKNSALTTGTSSQGCHCFFNTPSPRSEDSATPVRSEHGFSDDEIMANL